MPHNDVKYEDLRQEDDTESLMHNGTSPHARRSSGLFSYRTAFYALLAGSLMVFFTIFTFGNVTYKRSVLKSDDYFPDFGPHERVGFTHYPEFEQSLPREPGSIWNSIMPDNYGFVAIKNPSQYNLTGGLPVDVKTNTPHAEWFRTSGQDPEDTEVFVLSMYHQLHCLIMIRDTTMIRDPVTNKVVWGVDESYTKNNQHLNHCFDYLRQAIMCAGDTAFDRYAFDDSGPKFEYGVNGRGTTHKCRNFNAIKDYTNEVGWDRDATELKLHHA